MSSTETTPAYRDSTWRDDADRGGGTDEQDVAASGQRREPTQTGLTQDLRRFVTALRNLGRSQMEHRVALPVDAGFCVR
jgi:hypothetical protein